ncbi:ABC transporter ATP-binding protein [Geomicrobium sp. JCM 19039]|uniref:ABC transporter ATP-binding protein n=1 Tax=Geomicrobium sp. JCM 19039 TaxID=1460636 RepID=UPI00045F333C|nr:ABC transporter ATP-binding protein [Geomicrobium sp. JCM 19039]GAK13282.1 branched-chain amino acid transport ATP-binding protein LivF [Geomicrobium sp. JCM 19039]
MTMLQVRNIETYIQEFHILQGVEFDVPEQEVTVLLGRNGAGKTTTMRSIMGLNPATKGDILFQGESIRELPPHVIAKKGIGYVPEDQDIFSDLTVQENLRVAKRKENEKTEEREKWILELFPDLKIAYTRKGGNLSGGQKQMLSIARALVNETPLLLIDEPSKGLAPIMVEKVMEALNVIKQTTTVLLVEQNFRMASKIGERFYILDEGRTVHHGQMRQLEEDKELRQKYLGIA